MNSYITIPKDQRSTGKEYPLPASVYGAI